MYYCVQLNAIDYYCDQCVVLVCASNGCASVVILILMMARSVGLVNGELDNTEAKQHNMTVFFFDC